MIEVLSFDKYYYACRHPSRELATYRQARDHIVKVQCKHIMCVGPFVNDVNIRWSGSRLTIVWSGEDCDIWINVLLKHHKHRTERTTTSRTLDGSGLLAGCSSRCVAFQITLLAYKMSRATLRWERYAPMAKSTQQCESWEVGFAPYAMALENASKSAGHLISESRRRRRRAAQFEGCPTFRAVYVGKRSVWSAIRIIEHRFIDITGLRTTLKYVIIWPCCTIFKKSKKRAPRKPAGSRRGSQYG